MFRLLQLPDWSVVTPSIRRPRTAAAMSVSLVLLAWWLLGDHDFQAASDVLRDEISSAWKSDKVRQRGLELQIDEAHTSVAELIEVHADIVAKIESVDHTIKQRMNEQERDKRTAEECDKHLEAVSEGEMVVIAGRKFTQADVQREAEIVDGRYQARNEEIKEWQSHRVSLDCQRLEVQTEIADLQGRLRKLENGMDRVHVLAEKQRIIETFAAIKGNGGDQALSQAERDLAEFEQKLKIREIRSDGKRKGSHYSPTPVAVEIERALNPKKSIRSRVTDVIGS